MKSVLAWHFIKPDKKERFEPYRKIVKGKTLTCDKDKLEMCSYGLHASVNSLDALQYLDWENAIICRVKLSGKMIIGNDKICAEKRTVLWMAKCDRALHEFAVWCAEQCLSEFEKEYPEDKRLSLAIEAKKKWLKGLITDGELDAASSAAWSAVWSAVSSAASSAASSAVWSAVRSAASSAESSAAWSAASSAERSAKRSAVWSAERSAAWSGQNKQLTKMFNKLK